ncbi:endocuticle structural glycoprotein SgAbd-2-like [Sitophilus oryzae]|uniref:Endocuticle structural glycoprotein SgAbd-2-like n=1 Tax=Sitophilus oryzae TaxID=7048 RepID=A0A6J2XLF1_SITOR|nr:endocuticle structural glycoprotein SgAbd-2-like [Sitophilus oryzae]
MQQTIVISAILGFAACAQLNNLYLPPNPSSAGSLGPNNAPFGGAAGRSTGGSFSTNPLNNVPIVKFAAENEGEGTYRYNYETGNSITAEEQGDARGDGTKAHGSYSYTNPNGEHVSITYTADENGFVPQGSHIPTPPPIPEAILKALQENAAAEARGVFDDGQYHGEGLSEAQYHGEGLAEAAAGAEASGRAGAGASAKAGASAAARYAANGGYRY